MSKIITQTRLHELLAYNFHTGIFTWNVSRECNKKGNIAGTPKHGYVQIKLDKKIYSAHRLAWLYVYGKFPENQIDHINHNRSDNSMGNLRHVDNQGNQRNKKIQSNNSSGVHGVHWKTQYSKWCAKIYVDRKAIHLGYFVEFHEAVNARKNAEVLYGFHKNHGKDL